MEFLKGCSRNICYRCPYGVRVKLSTTTTFYTTYGLKKRTSPSRASPTSPAPPLLLTTPFPPPPKPTRWWWLRSRRRWAGAASRPARPDAFVAHCGVAQGRTWRSAVCEGAGRWRDTETGVEMDGTCKNKESTIIIISASCKFDLSHRMRKTVAGARSSTVRWRWGST